MKIPQPKFTSLPVSVLHKAEWNYKTEDARLSEKLRNNIKKNGQIENLIVRSLASGGYEVVNGNHRLDVLRELGVSEVAVCDLGEVSDAYAKRVAIETNETRFENDSQRLHDVFADLRASFDETDLLETMPFSDIEMSSLLADAFDFSVFEKTESEDTNDTETEDSEEEQEFVFELLIEGSTYERLEELQGRAKKYGFETDNDFTVLINDTLTSYLNGRDDKQ